MAGSDQAGSDATPDAPVPGKRQSVVFHPLNSAATQNASSTFFCSGSIPLFKS